MAEIHPLYHHILERLLAEDDRDFLPDLETRRAGWLQVLGNDENDTDIVNLGAEVDPMDFAAGRLFEPGELDG